MGAAARVRQDTDQPESFSGEILAEESDATQKALGGENPPRCVWLAAQPHGYADHGPGWGLGVAANHNTLRAVDVLLKAILGDVQFIFCELPHTSEKTVQGQIKDCFFSCRKATPRAARVVRG
jgi:hypothetical protein